MIRIVPEWNVKKNLVRHYTIDNFIRIVPEWNVKPSTVKLHCHEDED